MKIIVDAMGGDNAPLEVVKGALKAREEYGTDIVLVGSGEEILRCFEAIGMTNLPDGVSIVNASQVVTMEDDPAKACREKRDSSMTVALNMLRDGLGDAVVSAGSTGALLSGATLIVKRIRGIRRACLAPTVPTMKGTESILLDVGANAECTAEYIVQFAFMGYAYAKYELGVENPTVGLLNIGAEETKGGALQKQVHAFLTAAAEAGKINFVGNVEGTDALSGKVDVIVTDGFSGNIMLKSMEGAIGFLLSELKGIMYKNVKNKLAAAILKNDLYALKGKLGVGGSIMLGLTKPVIKAHGSSKEKEISLAIGQAVRSAQAGVSEEITSLLEAMEIPEENK